MNEKRDTLFYFHDLTCVYVVVEKMLSGSPSFLVQMRSKILFPFSIFSSSYCIVLSLLYTWFALCLSVITWLRLEIEVKNLIRGRDRLERLHYYCCFCLQEDWLLFPFIECYPVERKIPKSLSLTSPLFMVHEHTSITLMDCIMNPFILESFFTIEFMMNKNHERNPRKNGLLELFIRSYFTFFFASVQFHYPILLFFFSCILSSNFTPKFVSWLTNNKEG